MLSASNNRFPPKLDRWISDRKIKIELALGFFVFVSLLMYYAGFGEVKQMLFLPFFFLSVFYFLAAYLTPDIQGWFGGIFQKVASISSSVIVIGFLFAILDLEGAQQMMLIGGTSLAIVVFLLAGYSIFHPEKQKITPLIIRFAIMATGYGILVYSNPKLLVIPFK